MPKQTKRKNKTSSKKVFLTHLKPSLTYIAPHTHTGKRIGHRHTSHGALLLILLLAGVILFLNLASLRAAGITSSGQVGVSMTVYGDPPTAGAVITDPTEARVFQSSLVDIKGTCPAGTLVALYRNGEFAGSSPCGTDDTFVIRVQLYNGQNILQAQNYDDLNQTGPVTGLVSVTLELPVTPFDPANPMVVTPTEPTTEPSTQPQPIPNPLPKPADNPCYQLRTPAGSNRLGISVSCVTRNIFVGEVLSLPVSIYGGQPPYALSVDWDDETEDYLFSIANSGNRVLQHSYMTSTPRTVKLKLADSANRSIQVQTMIIVNGQPAAASPTETITNSFSSTWLEATIPVYIAAVLLVLGFWIGDVFQRTFGTTKKPRRTHA